MNDLISRSYILNIIEMWMKVPSYSESERNIMRAIDYEVRSAPSADPGWIPVTERLPDSGGLYFVTLVSGEVATSYFNGENRCFSGFKDVMAWMPLPEPYHPKEGQK